MTESNLEKIMLQKMTQSRSKSKFRETTLSKIKDTNEKSMD